MNWLSSAIVVIAVMVLWALRGRTRDVPRFANRLILGGLIGTAVTFVGWYFVRPEPLSDLNLFFATVISVMFVTSLIGLGVKIQHREAIMRATRR